MSQADFPWRPDPPSPRPSLGSIGCLSIRHHWTDLSVAGIFAHHIRGYWRAHYRRRKATLKMTVGRNDALLVVCVS